VSRKARLGLWAIAAIMFAFAVLWAGGLFDAAQALSEYLYPTTVEGMYLPHGCIETNETPPPDLMRIVEAQKNLYHLTLQKTVVCRSARRLLGFEQRFAGLPLGEGDPCRRLSKGCCSCQFGRHVIVAAADPRENGSVLVHANLVQSRWDYLRLKWDKSGRRSWFWWWPIAGTLLLVLALYKIVSKPAPSPHSAANA
jgi:hypothetical protein